VKWSRIKSNTQHKYLATIRKPHKKRTTPSTAARILPPGPAPLTCPQTTGPQTSKPITHIPTNPLTTTTLVPRPSTKAHLLENRFLFMILRGLTNPLLLNSIYIMFSSSTETAFSTAKRRILYGEDSILNKSQGGGSGGMCLSGGGLGGG
jgi:hypothetical protein